MPCGQDARLFLVYCPSELVPILLLIVVRKIVLRSLSEGPNIGPNTTRISNKPFILSPKLNDFVTNTRYKKPDNQKKILSLTLTVVKFSIWESQSYSIFLSFLFGTRYHWRTNTGLKENRAAVMTFPYRISKEDSRISDDNKLSEENYLFYTSFVPLYIIETKKILNTSHLIYDLSDLKEVLTFFTSLFFNLVMSCNDYNILR